MKKLTGLLLLIIFCNTSTKAQLFDKIKNKVNDKINSAMTKKSKKSSDSTKTSSDSTGNASNPGAGSSDSGSGGSANGGGSTPNDPGAKAGAQQDPQDIKSYSKFDFVPGEKIIVEEDFSKDAVGDFPDKWNTKTSAEVVTLNNRPGHWLCMKQDGIFFPEYIPTLPDNFTFQMDVIANDDVPNIATLYVTLAGAKDASEHFNLGESHNSLSVPGIKLELEPVSSGGGQFSYATHALGSTNVGRLDEWHVPGKNFATISLWRQKTRVRVYLNATKVLDLPRALETDALINSLVLTAYAIDYGKKGGAFYVSNIRLAVGAPDTRNKLITEGKFVTHGILFDVNSDKIKPASYGALQDIANALSSNAAVRVKIIGHTDGDGDDKLNLELSKKRADAVKAALTSTFGIDASRLETDGKGKSQPIDSNATSEGKANNRRVEFIKL